MEPESRDDSLEDEPERFDWMPPPGDSDAPPLSHIEFRAKPELEGMSELASPNGAYLVMEPDGEGAIVYTNWPRDLAMKMLVAAVGEPLKWINVTEHPED
jgi:hypothetical protein